MYTPHTVTIYNATTDPVTLSIAYNITVIEGVFLDVSKAANVQKTGLGDADSATLYIPFNVTARDGTTGAIKAYKPPKEYRAFSDKSGYWTIEPGGKDSSIGCFFVKGRAVSDAGYKYLRENFDHVYDVTTVDIRDFGSADMQHWQVGGR